MARHIWSVLCRGSSVDRESNLLSLFDIVEEFTIQALPNDAKVDDLELGKSVLGGVDFFCFSLWERDDYDRPEKGQFRIVVSPPKGKKRNTKALELDLSAHERLRTRAVVQGLRWGGFGRYEILVQRSRGAEKHSVWRTEARLPLYVKAGKELVPPAPRRAKGSKPPK